MDTRRPDHYLWAMAAGVGVAVADVRKISVALTEDEAADLRAAVDSDAYASSDEIVREAIADWRIEHAQLEDDISRLRDLWDAGKDRGATRPLDIEWTLVAARERLGTAEAV
jgi:antitoxin ParD1/3/4